MENFLAPNNMTETEKAIYNAVKDNLGEHLTLNSNVPIEVGCAECQSKLLALAGIPIPKNGIAGTIEFNAWLLANPDFQKKDKPEQGSIIVAVTGTGNGKVGNGHIGTICAFDLMYSQDWGIASNDSTTGLLRELWSYEKFVEYYGTYGGLEINIFGAL